MVNPFQFCCVLLFLSIGCASPKQYSLIEQKVLRRHLVAFDATGDPLNPNAYTRGWKLGDQTLTDLDYQQKLIEIAASAREFLAQDKDHRILLFIHGGMTSHEDSIERVLHDTKKIQEAGYYPIFVAWNSGFTSSYFHHLVHVEGRVSWRRLLFSPVIIAKDLVLGVMNLPRRTLDAAKDPFPIFDGELKRAREAASRASGIESQFRLAIDQQYRQLETHKLSAEATPIDLITPVQIGGIEAQGFGDWYRYSNTSAKYVLAPVSAATSFFIDSFGKRSWQGMLLRTKLLLDDVRDLDRTAFSPPRGVSALLKELQHLQDTLAVEEVARAADGAPDGEDGGRRYEAKTSAQVGLIALHQGLERMLQKFENQDFEQLFTKLSLSFQQLGKEPPAGIELIDSLIAMLSGQAPPQDPQLTEGASGSFTDFIQVLSLIALAPGDGNRVVGLTDALQALLRVDKEILGEIRAGLERLKSDALQDGLDASTELEPALRNFKHLVEKAIARVRRSEVRIDLFAHSMGTIIANEILKRASWDPVPRFENLIYMGAACTIRQYEEAVFSYLVDQKKYGTRFYNLMLHPEAEVEENMCYDVIPRGSLLVYIDQYLTAPETPRDRTLGRYQNIFRSIHGTRPEVADQIHIKVFPAGEGWSERYCWEMDEEARATEAHTGFTPRQFWLESYWRVPTVIERANHKYELMNSARPDPHSSLPAEAGVETGGG